MTARVTFAPAPTTPGATPRAQPVGGGATAPQSAAAALVVTRPAAGTVPASLRPASPRLTRRRSGPSLLARLARWLRLGRIQLGNLTAEDLRVLAYLAVALFIAFGGQIALDAPVEPPSLVPPGGQITAAAQVLDLARAEIGTTEARNGGTPYHEAYGLPDDQPWCAVFIWDLFQDAGGEASIGPKTAYTPSMARWFQERNQWTTTPTVGALVFYDWPDSKHRIQHVGLIEAVDANTVTVIEGNTNPGAKGSQDNGDGVYRRVRPRNGSIVGYGLPIYGLGSFQP